MKYHRNLQADRVRRMPWKTQVGMIASELSRAHHLCERNGEPEALGCLHRARELLGIADSAATFPTEVLAELARIAEELSLPRLPGASGKSGELYRRLMAIYQGRSSP